MRLVTYRQGGVTSYGVVVDDGVVDCGHRLGRALPSVRSVLEADALTVVAGTVASRAPDVALDDVDLLPPIEAGKVLCAGLNYHAHREEATGHGVHHPTIFTRFADTHVGHEQPILRPAVTEAFDYEGELAVVIGTEGFRVDPSVAMRLVAGYSCYDDATVRDWQRHSSQWIPGKNFPATGGFGPWLVTADEMPELGTVSLTTRVNGDMRQHARVRDLIFSVAELIVYISTFTRLRPGDVIATGTPGGVGAFRDPPEYLDPGDIVEVEISGIGVLRNRVEQG